MRYTSFTRAGLAALALSFPQIAPAQEGTSTADTPLDRVKQIQEYFADPANAVSFQFASPETHYIWQHVSQIFPTARFTRSGMPTVLETAP